MAGEDCGEDFADVLFVTEVVGVVGVAGVGFAAIPGMMDFTGELEFIIQI